MLMPFADSVSQIVYSRFYVHAFPGNLTHDLVIASTMLYRLIHSH